MLLFITALWSLWKEWNSQYFQISHCCYNPNLLGLPSGYILDLSDQAVMRYVASLLDRSWNKIIADFSCHHPILPKGSPLSPGSLKVDRDAGAFGIQPMLDSAVLYKTKIKWLSKVTKTWLASTVPTKKTLCTCLTCNGRHPMHNL